MKSSVLIIVVAIVIAVGSVSKRLIQYHELQQKPVAFYQHVQVRVGRVLQILKHQSHRLRFLLSVKDIGRVDVSWYGAYASVEPGQVWRFALRFKPLQFEHIPVVWDMGEYRWSKGIFLTASVVHRHANRCLRDMWWYSSTARLNAWLMPLMQNWLGHGQFSGVITG